MSGKKQKQPTWFDCSKCGRRLTRQSAQKHGDLNCELIYPFIFDGCLYSTISKATSSGIISLPFVKNIRMSSSTIFLSEELIRECSFPTFRWVSVTPVFNEEKSDLSVAHNPGIALRVWPVPDSSQNQYQTLLTVDGLLVNPSLSLKSDVISCVKIQNISGSSAMPASMFPSAYELTLELDNVENIDGISFTAERFIQTFLSVFKGRLVARGNQFQIRYYSEIIQFCVKDLKYESLEGTDVSSKLENLSLENNGKSKITDSYAEIESMTKVRIVTKSDEDLEDFGVHQYPIISISDVGGLSTVIKEISSYVNFALTTNLTGTGVSKGILLHGHTGTGKSLLVQAICNHFNMHAIRFEEFRSLDIPRLKQFGTSTSSLDEAFNMAISKQPAAIIIENIDTLAVKRNDIDYTVSSFSTNLRSQMNLLSSGTTKVIIFATSSDVDTIDPSVRIPHIFGKEIELPVPSAPDREDILNVILKQMKHSMSADNIKAIADVTHGFVGADLQGLCSQAAINVIEERVMNQSTTVTESENASITLKDIQEAMKTVRPSAMKSILVDVPNVRWGDIGGQEDLKFKLKQAIEWPLKHPDAFLRLGITPPKGILMYGPPGCSKTMIAKAIATESGLNFISVKGSELFSKWVGESEKAVQKVFRKARQVAPSVVFFDEIDSLGGERGSNSGSSNVHERVLAQLLVEIDGIETLKDVTIVAATNRPDMIDQALLRPGRLDRIIYVPMPDSQTRRDILRIRFKKMPIHPEVDIMQLVQKTDGYSGAELTAVCHEAALKALEEDIEAKVILDKHFTAALEIVWPRISKEQILFYENYSNSRKTS